MTTAASSEWLSNRPPWGRRDLFALLAWSVAVAIVFRDCVLFGGALFYFDITELNYPYRAFLFRELSAGRLSFWLPNLYCGLPLFSESQAGYFHPLKYFLYPWMATWRAFNLDTVLSVWLAGAGTYGWLRRHVGTVGALTGAAIVGLGGYTWAHLIHTSMINALASVPFAIWALESAWDGGRYRAVALGAIALAFQVFAGHLQDTILTGSALGVYTLIRASGEQRTRARLHVLGTAAGMVVLAGLISAVQWVPSKELLDRSPRAGGLTWDNQTYGSWHPQLLPTLILHEAYGSRARDTDWMDGFYPYHEMDGYLGLVGLFLAAVGASAWRDRWVGSWMIVGAIGGLLMLGRFTFLMDDFHRVPILGSSRIPVRYHLWVTLAVAAVAAVGTDRLARPGRVRLMPAATAIGLLVVAGLTIALASYWPAIFDSSRWPREEQRTKFVWLAAQIARAAATAVALMLACGIASSRAARTADPKRRGALAAILPLLAIADMALAHRDDVPTVPPSYWSEPPESARRLRDDPRLIRIYGEGTYSSGEPGHASKPIDFMVVRETIAWSLPAAWDLPSTGGETPILSRRRFRFGEWQSPTRYDLEGLSHVLSVKPNIERLGPAEKAGAAYIHRNPRALPRVRIVGRPVYAQDERSAASTLKAMGKEASARVVVEDPSRPMDGTRDAIGTARVVREVPDRVEISAEADRDAYLLLSDTYDPGWSATVDGIPAPIRPANVAFRAVFLTKGTHKVVFTYRPVGLMAGLAATASGLVLAIVILAWGGPRIEVRGAHEGLPRWSRWPVLLIVVVSFVMLGSVVRLGTASWLQPRWSNSWHPFTWAAKIEAIQPPPPPLG